MTFDSLGIASVILYTAWTTYVLYGRYHRDILKSGSVSLLYLSEAFYCATMLFLLLIQSRLFLYFTLAVALFHASAGAYTEVFKPQDTVSSTTMTRYWSYLAIDLAISLICYLMMST